MLRKAGSLFICLLIIQSTIVVLGLQPIEDGLFLPSGPPVGNYSPRAPIRIDSNADFDAAHGVVNWATGNGSAGNPWIIENYDINGTDFGYCIYIGNTTDFFVVRNCVLHDATGMINPPFQSCSGLLLYNVVNALITNNTLTNNLFYGIQLYLSRSNTITNNTVTNNGFHGIDLWTSNLFNTISYNTISSNSQYGINIFTSSSVVISNNDVSNNIYGLMFENGGNSDITNNNFTNNQIGMFLKDTVSHIIRGNNMVNDGIFISGNVDLYWITHSILSSNTVNNKPVYFWKNKVAGTVPTGAGEVILANCTNVIVENQNINQGYVGILLGYSTNNIIRNNTATGNNFGMFFSSGYNTISYNVISQNTAGIRLSSANNDVYRNNLSNNQRGIYLYNAEANIIFENDLFNNGNGTYLYNSEKNKLFHNNFLSNSIQAYDNQLTNFWNDTYPSGGNYWSDYVGVDFNSTPAQNIPPPDGIGDSPYIIDGNSQDNYPLMDPIRNIIIPLLQGWNLISLPLKQSAESIDTILASIEGKWNYIQVYNTTDPDHWKTNATFKPDQLNDLKSLNHKMGLWVYITEPNVNLTVHGNEPITTSIPLYAGWNLIGYPAQDDTWYTVDDLKMATGATIVEGFNVTAPYRISILNDSYVLKKGEGYWVHVPADSVWVVDW